MIGKRRSKQSNGTIFCHPKNVDKHQYYRESMNSLLLPYVRSMVNVLREEALYTNYSSGEGLMSLYKKILRKDQYIDLCEQTILTQMNFHNTIHRDCRSTLNSVDSVSIWNDCSVKNYHLSHVKRYIGELMKETNGYLPKSTTCCWSLRKEMSEFCHIQYFVDIDHGYAYDLSSPLLSNNNNIGATFQSSLFRHCTTVPIWKDLNGNYHLHGPDQMYNFAWVTDGGS